MFSSKLKRPALALAVTAGLLAVAGPASAGTTNEPKGGPPTNATASIIVYDFEGEPVHQVPKGGSIWAPGDGSDFVVGPASLKAGSNEVLMETFISPNDGQEVF